MRAPAGERRLAASADPRRKGLKHLTHVRSDEIRCTTTLEKLKSEIGYKNFTTSNLNDRGTFPVEKRSAKVHKDYLRSGRDLDHKFHNTQPGEVGPIEAKLFEYGAKDGPNPHAVVGLVLGAFGELSISC